MARIRIPGDELSHTLDLLQRIRDRIDRSASLESVGTEDDVGDSNLSDAVTGFDSAWKGGQERVQENVDTYRKAVEGILENFEKTDTDLGAQLDTPAE
jgi:hypothetical protein